MAEPARRLALRFLGVGSARAVELGASSAVLEQDGQPLLLIDVGPGVLDRYHARYGSLPAAMFLTHPHIDHIGDFEHWFYRLAFVHAALPRLYVPVPLVRWLHKRVAAFPNWVAEGGRNFWDVFHLIPVDEHFWHAGWRFEVFPARHHAPDAAFGLALAGAFAYSGDTRPIPEQLARHAGRGERVFHDCTVEGNPSHTGLDDLAREYPEGLRARMVLYHYADENAATAMRRAGFEAARMGEAYELPDPADEARGPWSGREND